MDLHTTTGRWHLGLALAIVTSILWGVLPIVLKGLLDYMDAYTITWYRFLIAAAILFIFVIRKHGLPSANKLRNSVIYLLIVAGIGLCGNYILYLLGLDYTSPSTAAIVIQLAPMFMLFGSLVVFKEQFSAGQWIGFLVLVFGMILFFNNRLDALLYRLNNYTIGVLLIVSSGILWAIYALTQKQLLDAFSSETIMLFIYFMGILFFFPFSEPVKVIQLDSIRLLMLGFCALNTLIAYGCFAEALNHWEASRVSMILAITPLITVIGTKLCSIFFPGFINLEQLNILSITGAILVVAGSMFCVLNRTSAIKPIKGKAK